VNTNVRIASFILVGLVMWFLSGLLATSEPSLESSRFEQLTVVEAELFHQSLFRPIVSLRANTEPNRSINLVAQIAGQVSAVLVEQGEEVIKGQVVCEIEPEDRYLRLTQSEANFDLADIAHKGSLKLQSSGFQSELAIAKSRAQLETARADHLKAQMMVDHLKIKAPFDGIVEKRPLEIGDYVIPGRICARLVDLQPIKILAIVNENEIKKIQLDSSASVAIEGNESLDASLSYLAFEADPVTRSYQVEAVVENNDKSIRAGLSATLKVKTDGILGHLISASSVLLDDKGGLFVRIIEKGNIVQSVSVQALGEEENGVWVSGLPKKSNVITVGQNYVIHNEEVSPIFVANDNI
jgi:multidrug efflux system membrane fusion protein